MRPLLTATAVLLVVGVIYAFSCWVWPMRDCWCCDGTGHHRPKKDDGKKRPRGRVSRPCRWCRRSGKRLRIGRRLWNRARRRAREAA